jgi:hypothetical protein
MNLATETFALPTNSSGPGNHKPPHRHVPHFAAIPNEIISFLTPYSGLLLTIWLIILYSIKRYFLEMFLFPRVYKKTYLPMDDGNKRGFLVHHVSAGTKIVLLVVGAKPWADVIFGHSALHDGINKRGARPTMGDILLVLTQLFMALYLFELMIRKSPSPICVAHHVGAVLIGQSAVALSLRVDQETNATMEFVLCLVWAAFDVLAELWLNFAFILYRVFPTNHHLLAKVFGGTAIISSVGTLTETIMVMTLFGQAWDKWNLSFKIVTPILHILFTVAQIHAAKILFIMWGKQKLLIAAENRDLNDLEGHSKKVDSEDRSAADDSIMEMETPPSTSRGNDSFATLPSDASPKKPKQSTWGPLRKFVPGQQR